ncbi:hypothetical protein [Spirosoma migulaei]
MSDTALESMCKIHFTEYSKVLLVMGKGFDIRMNITLSQLKQSNADLDIDCLLIEFDEGDESSSHSYKDLVDNNVDELNKLLPSAKIIKRSIKLWTSDGNKKRRVGDRKAAELISDELIKDYTDIIVDISALPRGIYFSLIGKLLTLIDFQEGRKPNLMVTVAENSTLDTAIKEDAPYEDLSFIYGFSGDLDLSSSDQVEPLIWLPILGENKLVNIRKANVHLAPSEICPVLPFPSKDPRRPDSLIISYHELLFDELRVEPQNIMYVPEQNPFEAYRILSNTINNYTSSLNILGGCKAVLSTFSSKLLSIGTLLAAYELKSKGVGVGVLSVDSQGYTLDKKLDLDRLRSESKLFLIWLTGEPYDER